MRDDFEELVISFSFGDVESKNRLIFVVWLFKC